VLKRKNESGETKSNYRKMFSILFFFVFSNKGNILDSTKSGPYLTKTKILNKSFPVNTHTHTHTHTHISCISLANETVSMIEKI
jgi:hypothetical protein